MPAEPASPLAADPPPPTEADIEAMRRHRADAHGATFDLERDVSFAGNVSATAPLTYTAPTAARGGAFHCADCPGRIFTLGDPFAGTPGRRAHLRLTDPNLKALLAGTAPEEQDALIDLYIDQGVGAALLNRPAEPPPPPTHAEPAAPAATTTAAEPAPPPAKERRPETVAREIGCQQFLLERRAAGRTVEEAIDDLVDLHETNRPRYRQIVDGDRLYARNTFNDYYKHLTPQQKADAKAAYAKARAAGAKPKRGKFTG